jgi:hypothetical protein
MGALLEPTPATDGACSPCDPPDRGQSSPLTEMPTDIQLAIMRELDGSALAALVDCTSRDLASALGAHVGPFWRSLHVELAREGAVKGPDDSIEDDAVAQLKSDFVQAWAAAEARCPRCGRQSRESGVLDIQGRAQKHLCDWFNTPERDAANATRRARKLDKPAKLASTEEAPDGRHSPSSVQTTLLDLWGIRPAAAAEASDE